MYRRGQLADLNEATDEDDMMETGRTEESDAADTSQTQTNPELAQRNADVMVQRQVEPVAPSASQTQQQQISAVNMLLRANPMRDPYTSIFNPLDNDQGNLSNAWKNIDARGSKPPSDFCQTKIKHTHDLLQVADYAAEAASKQSSIEWLNTHGLTAMGLTIEKLVEQGKPGKPIPDGVTGRPRLHLSFDAAVVIEFEYRIHLAVEMFTQRLKWCLQGSRRVFGLSKGKNVGILMDTSDSNMGFGRSIEYQQNLLHFLDEQISEKSSLYLASFGTDISPLWKNAINVSCRSLEEAKQFINTLKASGGCNLLKIFKQIVFVKGLDHLVLILGSVPDQDPDILIDFIYQLFLGRNIPVHTVAYDCTNHLVVNTLRKIAEITGGMYHCYSATCEEHIYTGTDFTRLLQEISFAQDLIQKVRGMKQGSLDNYMVSILNEIEHEVSKMPITKFLPRPPGHEEVLELNIVPSFNPLPSPDWLKQSGLKAKNLDLYQVVELMEYKSKNKIPNYRPQKDKKVLGPNSHTYKETYIPSINKTVTSQVHHNAMVQFQWHDGSVRNIHVDLSQLFEYQKQIGEQVEIFEQRINWLATGSRRLFGTVIEKNVVFILDLSINNLNYVVHIQHSLRLLFEQQLLNKNYFNIVAITCEIQAFSPTMVRCKSENLQAAWKWVLNLQCSGSRNFLGALRKVLENEEEKSHSVVPEGIYLFTSGIPDQPSEIVVSYLEESIAGRNAKLHTVLFNVDDYDSSGAIPSRYANITKTADTLRTMAHVTEGRFHWFRETGIIESDDIRALMAEIDKAMMYTRKCQELMDGVAKKSQLKELQQSGNIPMKERPSFGQLVNAPPTPPSPKSAVDNFKDLGVSLVKSKLVLNKLKKPETKDTSSSSTNQPNPMKSVNATKGLFRPPVKSAFYTEDRNKKGVILNTQQIVSNSATSNFKKIGKADIPDKEEAITSKDWMRKYSLLRLHLNLPHLVSGPECDHYGKKVAPLNKHVEAKYCDGIFPKVNVKGTLKHLHYNPAELRCYDREVFRALKRYVKRLEYLMSGSNQVFGVLAENPVVICIDVSGSMAPCMLDLKSHLKTLVWEQIYKRNIAFNLIAFSTQCRIWKESITLPDEDNCHSAIEWIETLEAGGNTNTYEAMNMALSQKGVNGVYLLSDGKPDNSTNTVLKMIKLSNEDITARVNTIAFNCEESSALAFLRQLASENNGRYHKVCSDFDARLFAHRLLNSQNGEPSSAGLQNLAMDPENPPLPAFQSDDLKRIAKEINLCRRQLAQSKYFQDLYYEVMGPSRYHRASDTQPSSNSAVSAGGK